MVPHFGCLDRLYRPRLIDNCTRLAQAVSYQSPFRSYPLYRAHSPSPPIRVHSGQLIVFIGIS